VLRQGRVAGVNPFVPSRHLTGEFQYKPRSPDKTRGLAYHDGYSIR